MFRGKINFQIFKYFFCFIIFGIALNLSISQVSAATTTLLSDNFTGTTISSIIWTEADAGGIGGGSGNVQQNDNLSLTGSGAWNANYLVTKNTFDRSSGSLAMEADITCTANGIVGVGYGDPGVLLGGGQSYTMYISNRVIHLSRQLSGSNAEDITTGFSCTAGVPFHIKIAINSDVGALLYINGNSTAIATSTGGTFNNKGFFLSGHSGAATLVDNFVVSGPDATTVPDAPTGLEATPSSEQAALTWSTPNNGGSPITDYFIEYKFSSTSTWSVFLDGVSNTTSALVTNLTNNTIYNFRVSAVNSVGTSSASGIVTTTPALSVPSAPRTLTASSNESNKSTLNWLAPLSNGGSSVTDYLVEYKTSTSSSWSIFSDGISISTSTIVTNLTNNTIYNFRVSAINSVGTSTVSNIASSTPSFVTLFDDFTGPTISSNNWIEIDSSGLGESSGKVQIYDGSLSITPSSSNWASQDGIKTTSTYDRTNGDLSMEFTVTRDTCGGVGPVAIGYGDMDFTINGSASYIFLSNVSNWELYYWINGANVSSPSSPVTLSPAISCTPGVPITFKLVINQTGGANIFINGSSTPSMVYTGGTFTNKTFWIGGYQSGGTVYYDNVAIIEPVTGPFAPTELNAEVGSNEVSLSWNEADSNGSPITDYLIQYKETSTSTWSTFLDGTSTSTMVTVTGLMNGINYNFRVLAINSNGTSDASIIVTSKPVSSTPTAPVASSVSITGSISVEEVITGTYTFFDVNGNSEASSLYRWLRSDTVGGLYSAIPGATSINYTITQNDLNKYLKFEVTPVANISPTTGIAVLSLASSQVNEIDYINQILSTGQSLSVGVNATPALSTTQPYHNLMLNGGNGGIGAGTSFVSLIESGVETISSAMANTITANDVGNDFDMLVSLHGVSGYTYSQLKKGTGPYSTGMTQVANAKNAAIATGTVSRVIGITTIHGETDNYNNVSGATYQGYLEEWQNDYNTDVKAITGQVTNIPLYLCQMSSFMSSYANDATSEIPIYQLKASVDNPGDIILVAPKYFFNYSDRHHLTGASSRWLGEYYGKVMKKVVIDHEAWRPLSPDSVTRSGNIIYANFHVPDGHLVFDTTLVSPRTNHGFEYYDSSSSATVSSTEIIDSNTVKITLTATPTGTNQRLRYAYTGIPGTNTGAQNAGSAAGNLRDTDDFPSLYGNTLYNWAVHFDELITIDPTPPTATVSYSTTNPTNGSVIATITPSESVTITNNSSLATYTFTENGSFTFEFIDGAGNTGSSTATVSNIDKVVPTITVSSSATTTSTTATISWTTNEQSSSKVDYGLTDTYTESTIESDTVSRVTSHEVTISDLLSCTNYHYRVRSSDVATNEVISTDNIFTTLGCTALSDIIASSTEQVATTTGGTLNLQDNNSNGLTLTIPANFASSTVNFQANQLNSSTVVAVISTPVGLSVAGNYMYQLQALSSVSTTVSTFAVPLSITITYDASSISSLDTSSLRIYRFDGSSWNELSNCSVDTTLRTVTCETTQFSTFGLFGQQVATVTETPTIGGGIPLYILNMMNNQNKQSTSTNTVYEGKLVKYVDSAKIYLIQDNKKKWIVNEESFNYYKYDWNKITIIEKDILFTDGLDIDISKQSNKYIFKRNLKLGMTGEDVRELQRYLNNHNFEISKSGYGSKGKETTYFGNSTRNALIKFQKANKISPANGLFGPLTRKVVNGLRE